MPSKKKTRPVAEVRHLMKLDSTPGWGSLENPKSGGFGENLWHHDEKLESIGLWGRSNTDRQFQVPPPLASAGYFELSSPEETREIEFTTPQHYCFLILLVPSKLEFVASNEVEALWKTDPQFRPGRVVVPIKRPEELQLCPQLRTILGSRVMVEEWLDCVNELTVNEKELELVAEKVEQLHWVTPLQVWAALSAHGKQYNAYEHPKRWFPDPSFRVQCQPGTSYGSIGSELCRMFQEGIVRLFNWEINTLSPDLDIVLEFYDNSLAAVIELEPCKVLNPFVSPYTPLRDCGVASTLLHVVHLQPTDILLNSTCGVVDVGAEITQCYPGVQAIVGDDRIESIQDSVTDAGQWASKRNVEGCQYQTDILPYRDNSFDVIISCFEVPEDTPDYEKNKIFTRRLKEIARVSRVGIARAVLITCETDLFEKPSDFAYWKVFNKVVTDFGPFSSSIYCLQRNNSPGPVQGDDYSLSRRAVSSMSRSRRPSRYKEHPRRNAQSLMRNPHLSESTKHGTGGMEWDPTH